MGKLVPCEGSQQHDLPILKAVFYISKFIDILIFCSKQDLSTLLPNPLLSSAQRTHNSVLDALSAGLVIPLDVVHETLGIFELPFAQ